ncbi:hypothetical protein FPZ24_15165 [Sphingomonas panacisoli]|uniref:Uncharacterized protein n=1 Tax=Sphingomonas panacisoli TaxID=1813879 RepID=A0A5B8LL30_9SPHN|nr:hypothetical protein [Sphingomonas panacisoli]QDZ08639.1 hypothetical protein FPZ24_15165 [Sphingomonas panacisoli]
MRVEFLDRRTQASPDSDRAVINRLPNGSAGFTASVHAADGKSLQSITRNCCHTHDEAVQAAIMWAREQGVQLLYVVQPNAN